MKKRIVLIMTIVIALAMIAIPTFAISLGESSSHDVKATYESNGSGGSSGTVYSVDITWDAMEFTYTQGAASVWLPDEHRYTDAGESVWSSDSNTITVKNHSNAAVTATLSYTAAAGYTGITGSFTETSGTADDGILVLPTAVGTTRDNAPTATATLTLSGELASTVTSLTTIGTVKVTLS